MARKFSELMKEMPASRRDEIARRKKELEREDVQFRRLQEIRQALAVTQVELAAELQINQSAVSKLESQSDMYVSTLKRIISALGGELHILVSFPDGSAFEISPFSTSLHASAKTD